ILDGDSNTVDEPLAIEMIRTAIDGGVNYIDTAYPYHGGNSERVLGKALQDGYREKVRVATKLPTWACHEKGDFDRLLDEQCERLGLDFIDFYLLHNLHAGVWPRMMELGALGWLEGLLAAGRVGHVGFSFHDGFEAFRTIVDAFDWTLCQIQYNFMNEKVQAGTAGLEYAAEKGMAVVVMEPLLGGCLVSPPEPIQAIWDEAPTPRTPADWALQWLWNKPEVAVVLSGMSAMEHVTQNLASADASGVGSLSSDERKLVQRAAWEYEKLNPAPCTRCGYCMPCPEGVDIPRNFQLYNDAETFKGAHEGLNRNLYAMQPETARASACVACRECEEKCPQSIEVSEWMPKVVERFTKT
ncbi:aldo/keto reductase, partial [bacterium]|nr:aldo/keto reductase [bacterium]